MDLKQERNTSNFTNGAKSPQTVLFSFVFFSASQDQIARLLSKQAGLEREFCSIYFAHKFSEER